jgi:hypothetical protein
MTSIQNCGVHDAEAIGEVVQSIFVCRLHLITMEVLFDVTAQSVFFQNEEKHRSLKPFIDQSLQVAVHIHETTKPDLGKQSLQLQ